ncbi:putative bifunctional diguanylate cyclase/phosphodiesterase [Alkalihalobacillus pseudalcaliphilus]|uniref:putative bifunctional diguanylate cyclase/phosphodiesterase n=1 Tax=Alkalihalobacillus pseudalcaliphilus TaxID=79884 RepID=UPI00069D1C27|nr:EAL domain-containing protein [Alkalihalobacillus pseudalcaliphilus]
MELLARMINNQNIFIHAWPDYVQTSISFTSLVNGLFVVQIIPALLVICAMFYLLKYHLCPKVIHELDELQCEVINSFEYGLIITDDHEQVIHTNDVFNHILQQLGREAPEDLTELDPNLVDFECSTIDIQLKSATKEMLIRVTKQKAVINHQIRHIWLFLDITKNKQLESELRHMAFHDQLTKLPNRHYIDEKINESIRLNRKISCLLLDIDRLKFTNDSFGHLAGDQLLIQLSNRFRKVISDDDILARIGGDEFVIIIFDERVQEIEAIADACISQVKTPFIIANQRIRVTLSGGISCYPDDVTSADELIRIADFATYDAKKAGKNQISFFNATIEKEVRRRLLMEELLHTALEADEFYLVYQTKVDLVTEKIKGTEALLRWKSPELGQISPGEFITVLEESGLIIEVGDWVLKQACIQWSAWQRLGMSPILMAVNISPIQFTNDSFIDDLKLIIAETGIDPNYLELEITESSAIAYTDETIEKLNALKNMGIKMALDDFGTGYSSFKHLNELPLEMLKIDRSFLKNLLGNQAQEAIVRSMIQLGHNMNLRVLMEGVEEQAQVDWLRGEGCDWVQGFLFSKPEKPEIVTKKLIGQFAG